MSQQDDFDKLYNWYVGDDATEASLYEIEKAKSELAEIAYNLRTRYGLSIEELSEITEIEPSEIDDLEEGNYPGNPNNKLVLKIERILTSRFGGTSSNPIKEEPGSLAYCALLTED